MVQTKVRRPTLFSTSGTIRKVGMTLLALSLPEALTLSYSTVQRLKVALSNLKVLVILYVRLFLFYPSFFFLFFFQLRSYIKNICDEKPSILLFHTGNTSIIAFTYNFNSLPL